jgi:hypothetical protein
MKREKIIQHAKKHFKREEGRIGYSLPWEQIRTSKDYIESHLPEYARRILEKKRFLGEETKSELYLILGLSSLWLSNYGDAKRYLILAKQKDLIATVEKTRIERMNEHQKAFEYGSGNPYSNN